MCKHNGKRQKGFDTDGNHGGTIYYYCSTCGQETSSREVNYTPSWAGGMG